MSGACVSITAMLPAPSLAVRCNIYNPAELNFTLNITSASGSQLECTSYYDLLASEESRTRRKRSLSYEHLINPQIERILTAKDAFFSTADVVVVVTRASSDVQMLTGAIRAVASHDVVAALCILHKSLEAFANLNLWLDAATETERLAIARATTECRLVFSIFATDDRNRNVKVKLTQSSST